MRKPIFYNKVYNNHPEVCKCVGIIRRGGNVQIQVFTFYYTYDNNVADEQPDEMSSELATRMLITGRRLARQLRGRGTSDGRCLLNSTIRATAGKEAACVAPSSLNISLECWVADDAATRRFDAKIDCL